MSDLETTALSAINADESLKEFLGPRADDSKAKLQMYSEIGTYGYVSSASLESSLQDKQTLNTISQYLVAAGMDNDLLVDYSELGKILDLT